MKLTEEKYRINIVIIEDDETIRDGYAYLITLNNDYRLINSYSSVEEALKTLTKDNPDVILIDVGLPGINGIDAIPKIKKLVNHASVIILTVYESEKIILSALSNGASGFLTKNSSAEKIISAIQEVMEGGAPMSMNVARTVINSFQKNQDSPLSKRETQILEQIGNGKNRTRIAEDLFIDMETVKTHIKNIYLKLNVHSREEAIKKAKTNKFI